MPPLDPSPVVIAPRYVAAAPTPAAPPLALVTDWQPMAVAALRAILTALLVGASTFLVTWSTTDSPKLLAIATATAVGSVLAARFGIEGAIDQAKHNAGS